MAAPIAGAPTAQLVFRSRAVRTAGLIELTLGLVTVLAAVGLVSTSGIRNAVPLGLVAGVLGVVLSLSGLGRITARMVVGKTDLTWTWSFSTHRLALDELDDAALVEKGSPASGGSWAGFLGGGFVATLAWWILDVMWALVTSEPSLGPVELIAIRHHGGPVSIKPIGAWSTRASQSEANQALQHLRVAIAKSAHAPSVTPKILRTDAWDTSGEH